MLPRHVADRLPIDEVVVGGAGALVAADAALGAWLRSSQGDEV